MGGEAVYQLKLIRRIQEMFPGCYILRNDPGMIQGLPDLLILFGMRWAMLEVKLSATAPIRPNQTYYVAKFDQMSFCAFIYPEIEEQVLHDLQSTFGADW